MEGTRLEIRLEEFSADEEKRLEKLGIKFPLYVKCYEDALKAILSSINYNQNSKKRKMNSDTFFVGMENGYAAPLEESNIIAFIGDRGSGKTTVINEFSRILHEYYDKYENWNLIPAYSGGRGYRFHVLAPIDASVLETKEDLMEVILASMYQAFEKKIDYHKNSVGRSDLIQNIVHDFDSAYQDYINVGRHGEQFGLGETALAKLKYISNSLKTKNTIKSLIDNFLDLLDERNRESKNSYLVVVIDDLDMSPENGYEMLEQLHKYLAYERVVILIAIKYEQMKMICDQHFVDCLTPEYGGAHEKVFNKFYKRAKTLSSDYLLKVLPMPNRVYMPKNNLRENGTIIELQKSQGKFLMKEFILRKIAVKMNIYYDANGLKRHFCLPDTVRELISYNDFLESLYSIEEIEQLKVKKHESWIGLYDQNHERFNNNIDYRMAIRILDDEQLELYRLIMARNIERRAKYAISFLGSWMDEKKKEEKDKREGQSKEKKDDGKIRMKDSVDEQKYCYANLLGIIYKLGREDYDDKVLVHCILASFTSEMVREYCSYKFNSDPRARRRAENRLKCFLGNTFGSEWFWKWMPKVKTPGLRIRWMEMGYFPNAKMSDFSYTYKLSGITDVEMGMKKLLSDIVPYIERLTLLLSHFRNEKGGKIGPEWKFSLNYEFVEDRYSISLDVGTGAKTAVYDIFGFIGKELRQEGGEDIRKLNENLIKDLRKCLEKALASLGCPEEKNKDLQNELEREVKQKSIWAKTKRKPGNIEFPYYNLDMSYNIMKRVMARLRENMQLREAGKYEYFCTVYTYVAEELKKEEDYYQVLLGKERTPHFLDNFVNAPYMKAFEIKVKGMEKPLNQQKDEDKNMMNEFLDSALECLGRDVLMPDIDMLDIHD